MALVTLKDVTVAFDGINAVENASFAIDRGDYVVLVGENGSGKSTLLRAILSLIRINSGSISFGDGLKQDHIGYLPQQTPTQRDFPASVEEVVLSGCVNKLGRKLFFGHNMRELAHEKLHMLGICALADKPYRTLSGGQQQRVLLARALCATDSLLLLDEPVTGLDPFSTKEMYDLIRSLNKKHGVAILMVSHDLRGALRDADKVAVVNRGIDFFGTIEAYTGHYRMEPEDSHEPLS